MKADGTYLREAARPPRRANVPNAPWRADPPAPGEPSPLVGEGREGVRRGNSLGEMPARRRGTSLLRTGTAPCERPPLPTLPHQGGGFAGGTLPPPSQLRPCHAAPGAAP